LTRRTRRERNRIGNRRSCCVVLLSFNSTRVYYIADVCVGENGEWRMENGEWRMENGEWRMESGKWRMDSVDLGRTT